MINLATKIDKRLRAQQKPQQDHIRFAPVSQQRVFLSRSLPPSLFPLLLPMTYMTHHLYLGSQTKLPSRLKRPLTKVIFMMNSDSLVLQVLVDSRAENNMMDDRVAKRLHQSHVKRSQPLSISPLNGILLCEVTHQRSSVTLVFESHQEELNLLFLKSVHHPLILGLPKWGKNCGEHFFFR